ncbi:ubiquitin carboxyl-terminal hydrolase 16-like isoform X2 [Sycon ciliatum]|uniref:ubiquitin carboxyl-terminal hydrolase 16-like isoform X2 n=1 Tax=Sycon ciliatum TaxID=27933 RepID=UPI0031F68DB4
MGGIVKAMGGHGKKRKQQQQVQQQRKDQANQKRQSLAAEATATGCPHVKKAVQFNNIRGAIRSSSVIECKDCKALSDAPKLEDAEICACLNCGRLSCVRATTHKHALKHQNQNKSHALVVNVVSFEVWCYECDRAVVAEPDTNLHACLIHIKRCFSNEKALEEEQALLRKKKLAIPSRSMPGIPVRGLINLGNTCFFNAIMQGLNQVYQLHERLEQLRPVGFEVPVRAQGRDSLVVRLEMGPGALTQAMQGLLTEFRVEGSGVISPRTVFSRISQVTPRFSSMQQQDSQELFSCLLNSIRTEEGKRVKSVVLKSLNLKNVPAAKVSDDDRAALRDYGKAIDQSSFVDEIFGGQTVSSVTCLECDTVSSIYEHFLDLPLPLPDDSPVRGNLYAAGVASLGGTAKKATQHSTKRNSEMAGRKSSHSSIVDDLISQVEPKKPAMSKHMSKKEARKQKKEAKRKGKQKGGGGKDDAQSDVCTSSSREDSRSADQAQEDTHSADQAQEDTHSATDTEQSAGSTETAAGGEQPAPRQEAKSTPEQLDVADSWEDLDNDGSAAVGNTSSGSSADACSASQRGESDSHSWSTACEVASYAGDSQLSITPVMSDQSPMHVSMGTSPLGSNVVDESHLQLDGSGSETGCNEHPTAYEVPVPVGKSDLAADGGLSLSDGSVDEKDNDCGHPASAAIAEDVPSAVDSGVGLCSSGGSSMVGQPVDVTSSSASDLTQAASIAAAKTTHVLPIDSANSQGVSSSVTGCPSVTCSPATIAVDSEKSVGRDGAATPAHSADAAAAAGQAVAGNNTAPTLVANSLQHYDPTSAKSLADTGLLDWSLAGSLKRFINAELLDGANKFGCQTCTDQQRQQLLADGNMGGEEKVSAVKTLASKQLLLHRLPSILTLHLKRFKHTSVSRAQKISKHVSFPFLLDMSQFCSASADVSRDANGKIVYSLFAVTEHSGNMRGGHYTAYVKSRKQQQPQQQVDVSAPSPAHSTGAAASASTARSEGEQPSIVSPTENDNKENAKETRNSATADAGELCAAEDVVRVETVVVTTDTPVVATEQGVLPGGTTPEDNFTDIAQTNTGSPVLDTVSAIDTPPRTPDETATPTSETGPAPDIPVAPSAGSSTASSAAYSVPDGSWFHVSDTCVRAASEEQVRNSQAYILFYERLLPS